MKRMKLLIAASLSISLTLCQVNGVAQNLQKGEKAYKSKKYQEALAYLSISISEDQTAAAYYYRSMTYSSLGDSCKSCKDLKKAAFLNDNESKKLFKQKCTITTELQKVPEQIKLLYPEVSKIKIVHYKCCSDTLILGFFGQEPQMSEIEIRMPESKIVYDKNDNPYVYVEEMPIFPGGEKARIRFINENIKYPEAALKNKISGTVYVGLTVDRNGNITDVSVPRGIGGGCDEEAIRVVKIMPQWMPGEQNGKSVSVKLTLPISFGPGK